MSITIRLSRIGKKNSPSYRVVVANTKDKRNGRSIDLLGHYNPTDTKTKLEIDKNKFEAWVEKGAIVTEAVTNLMEGKYSYTPYKPKKANEKTQE